MWKVAACVREILGTAVISPWLWLWLWFWARSSSRCSVILCSYCCLCCRCCCLTQKLLQQLLLLLSMATARHGMNHFTSECGTHKCTRAHSRTKCRLCFDLIWRFRGHRLKLYEGSSSIKRESFLPSFFLPYSFLFHFSLFVLTNLFFHSSLLHSFFLPSILYWHVCRTAVSTGKLNIKIIVSFFFLLFLWK